MDYGADYMSSELLPCIASYVFRAAERVPDRIALRDETTRYSYAELAAWLTQRMNCLIALGVRRGDRVAIMCPPTADSYALFLAVTGVGAIWTGINPRFTRREAHYVLSDAQPHLIMIAEKYLSEGSEWLSIAALHRDFPRTAHICAMSEVTRTDIEAIESPAHARANGPIAKPDDIAALVYTSGSSGAPKGCLLPNHSIVGRNTQYNKRLPVADYPRISSVMAMNHIAGTTMLPAAALMAEGSVVFREQFDPASVGRLIKEHSLNMYFGAPAMFELIRRAPTFDRSLFESLEWLIFGGAPLVRETLMTLQTLCPQVVSTWGMTETLGPTTFTAPGTETEELANSIGKPAIEGDVIVIREDGKVCQDGEQGEIRVRRTYCMAGYLNRPDADAEVFTADGWLRTGDIAEILPSGSLRFVGRMSDMFKSGGYNVYPREVEVVIEEHPAVALAAVLGVPDDVWGEVGNAYVQSKGGLRVSEQQIREWCKARLANYKIPKRFEMVDSLPLLPIGKVDKAALKRAQRNIDPGVDAQPSVT